MKLTVIVPVYNIKQHLERFFLSMANQSYEDYKMIVVDDGSEDESLNVCKHFSDNDDRITIVEASHSGVINARNTAIELADTEYIVFADGDDYVEPDYLEHLMNAQQKYNADLVISRVQYMLEDGTIGGEFRPRGELLISREDFKEKIPMLLDDRRLNYLYGKVYRTSLLKDIRVENDVRQGSDTMINFIYLMSVKSIVLIDDLDYHYIKYNSRSITSYSGDDAFNRLVRINKFVFECASSMNILTLELLRIIDLRILQSAYWVIEKIVISNNDDATKAYQISMILNNDSYIESYQRQKNNLKDIAFEIIEPQDGIKYLEKIKKAGKHNRVKAKMLRKCPKSFLKIYHRIKGVV